MDEKQKFRPKNAKFESLEQQQQKKRVKHIVFYVVLLVSFSTVFFLLWFLVFFKVKDVEITGNVRYSVGEIRSAAGIAEGDNLYSVGEAELNRRLTEKLPYVSAVTLERELPSTLRITVSETEAVMYSELYGGKYLISQDLVVLERSDNADTANMVEVSAGDVRKCYSGESLTYADVRMADVVRTLYATLAEYGLISGVDSFSIKNRFDISIRYRDKLDVYFGSIDNIDIKVRFFVGILEHLYEDDKGKLDISNIKEASFSRYND